MGGLDNPFVRRLRHGAALSPDDERLLVELSWPMRQLGQRQDIMTEGDEPHSLTLILDGWACRYRDLSDGRRQIISFFLPGDLCEPFGTLPKAIDHSIGTLTPVTYVRVSVDDAKRASRSSRQVEKALWWDALVAESMLHDNVVSLGQRTAFERLAHLFCALHYRLMLVGRADAAGFDLPLTQADLGHALGISTVHVNRSMKALHETGCVSVRDRRVTIRNLEGLRDLALFEAGFFHPLGTTS